MVVKIHCVNLRAFFSRITIRPSTRPTHRDRSLYWALRLWKSLALRRLGGTEKHTASCYMILHVLTGSEGALLSVVHHECMIQQRRARARADSHGNACDTVSADFPPTASDTLPICSKREAGSEKAPRRALSSVCTTDINLERAKGFEPSTPTLARLAIRPGSFENGQSP
jgi:hypothetical protein